MFDIPMNVKQGIDLGSLNTSTVVRSGILADQPAGAGCRPHMDNQPARPSAARPSAASPQPTQSRPKPPGSTIPGHQGMGAVLQKGQKTSLSSLSPNLEMIDVCMGWDVCGRSQYELDTECFMLGADGKVVGDEWFVFYNQPVSPDGAVRHFGVHKTGSGSGDDEILQINLARINPRAERLVFIMTINRAKELGLNFSGVSNAYIRVVDKGSSRELVRYPITEYYHTITSMVVGELYRYRNEWKFTPIGEGTRDDLYGLCMRYGVAIEG